MSHFSEADLPDLTGKTIVITGATSGLGLESARALGGAGARIVLAVRNLEKGAQVATSLHGRTEVRELDVADLASVRAFAAAWDRPLDVLINNAGILAPPEGRTVDGFELQIATNHLGPFMLTRLLLEHITDRVVTVTSQLHNRARLDLDDLNWDRRRYRATQAYNDSKLANVLFTLELQRRLQAAGSNVRAISAHPGIARTNLQSTAGGFSALFDRMLGRLFNDACTGALAIEYAATQDVPGGAIVGPDGLGHLRGRPAVHPLSRRASDASTARRLWERSTALTDARVPVHPRPSATVQ